MSRHRKTAILVGILSLFGMIAGGFSAVIVIESPDYLLKAAENEMQVLSGAFFQLLMIPVYVGIPLLLYPVLKKQYEGAALGFIGFRVIAAAFHFIGVCLLPLFILLSREFIQAGAPDVSYFQTIGELLRVGRDLINHVGMIVASSFGVLLYYFILFRTKLVPRWLSGWGLLGTLIGIAASILVLFDIVGVVTKVYMGMMVPIALQELTLAIWLIFKGFTIQAPGSDVK